MKKLLVFITVPFVILVTILGLSLGEKTISYLSAKKVTNQFFDHLASEDLEGAFKYLAYYDEAYDVEPKIEADEAKEIWIKRISDLKSNNMYVKGIEKLNIDLNDSHPMGSVVIIFNENGRLVKKNANISFTYNGGWKISAIQFVNKGKYEDHPLTIALSGYIK